MRTFVIPAAITAGLAILIGLLVGCDLGQPALHQSGRSDPAVQPPVQPPVQIPKPTTYSEAITISRQYNKPLFLIFSATWCNPCKKMKSDVWPDERVKEALEEYVVYMVDVDRERVVVDEVKIRAIPAYGIFDTSSGKIKPLRIATGGRNVEEFITWLVDSG